MILFLPRCLWCIIMYTFSDADWSLSKNQSSRKYNTDPDLFVKFQGVEEAFKFCGCAFKIWIWRTQPMHIYFHNFWNSNTTWNRISRLSYKSNPVLVIECVGIISCFFIYQVARFVVFLFFFVWKKCQNGLKADNIPWVDQTRHLRLRERKWNGIRWSRDIEILHKYGLAREASYVWARRRRIRDGNALYQIYDAFRFVCRGICKNSPSGIPPASALCASGILGMSLSLELRQVRNTLRVLAFILFEIWR